VAPAAVSADLQRQYHSNLGRSIRLRAQMLEALEACNQNGVVPTLLKGSRYVLDGTFADIGERFMADLDILVPAPAFADAVTALARVGYVARPRPGFTQPHELPMVHPERLAPVEIHRELGAPTLTSVLSTADYLGGTGEVSCGELRYRAATSTHTVLHHILHTQVQDRNHHAFGLPLRSLHTFRRLVAAHLGAIDWSQIRTQMDRGGQCDALDAYLVVAARYMPGAGDAPTPSRLRARQTVVTVSAALGWPSNLIINAEESLAPEYLRTRYGPDLSPSRLRLRHLATLWREQGRGVLRRATVERE
jgi:hypothetical protein